MKKVAAAISCVFISVVLHVNVSAQSDEFKYQGNLDFNGQPANGNFDFEFALFTALSGGNQIESTLTRTNVPVANGVFSVSLAFNDAFPGEHRFLEIRVRPVGNGAYTLLTPRQQVLATPYSITSQQASIAGRALEADFAELAGTAAIATNATNAETAQTALQANTAKTATSVTGIVGIANGGTGSAVKNFVDLSTDQSVAGNKSFTGTIGGNGSGLTSLNPSNLSPGVAGIDIAGSAAKSRIADNDNTPSVAGVTTLVFFNYSGGIITDLTDGVDGQCVTLISANGRQSLFDGGSFKLSKHWESYAEDTITLCKSSATGAPFWYERSRSSNVNYFGLQIFKLGTGDGNVTSSPTGISCGQDCSEEYPSGTLVTLTASAVAGSTFAGWSGGSCTGTGICQVSMTQFRNVSATFNSTTSQLTINRPGAGSGTVTSSPAGINCGADCSEVFSAGTVVTLTATPAVGSTFTGWSGLGCVGTSQCTVTLTEAFNNLSANFAVQASFTLTVSRTGNGTGIVTSSPGGINCGADCTQDYLDGTVVTLTATPAAGSTFTGWSGACTGTGVCQVTMNQARTVTATFTLVTYTLTVSMSNSAAGVVESTPLGINCPTDCTENFNHGTQVTLGAGATFDWTFTGWTGACTGMGPCIVTMNEAAAVTANFEPTSTLIVDRAGTGSGNVTSNPVGINCGLDCVHSYINGTVVTLTAAPAAGSTFSGWSGGGCTGTGTCVVNVTAATNVTATFSSQFVLTVSRAGTGTGTVTSSPLGISCGNDCTELYNSGTLVTLTATPAAGDTFAGWSGSGCTGTGTCVVQMSQARSVTATFNP